MPKQSDKVIQICYWYADLSEKTGLKRDQELPYEELFPTIQRLMDLGFYIMLKEYKEGERVFIMLAIDTCPFRTR